VVARHAPEIELFWWLGCPSWPRALEELRTAVLAVGLDPESIEVKEITTEEMAEREQFVGSPTIRIDGEDVQPPGPDEPAGLTCRVYRLRDGRVSPTPDPEDVRDRLAEATGESNGTKSRDRSNERSPG
jgi:hypothetical protein